MHPGILIDLNISDEIITDSKMDVGQNDVQILLQRMQQQLKWNGIVAIIINDIMERDLLNEVRIIGQEMDIMIDYGDEAEI